MTAFDPSQRSRIAEDEYFRRKEMESASRAREAHRISLEQTALADSLGAHDAGAVEQLYAHGLRASTAAVVEWLPAVDVAWLDGANEAERHAIRTQFAADDRATDDGIALLTGWLTERPPDGLFAAGRRALRSRLQALDPDARGAALARIVAVCEAAGRAAGGCFGVGALSSDERRHIAVIQRDLERQL